MRLLALLVLGFTLFAANAPVYAGLDCNSCVVADCSNC
jgi:hypothetical protein